MAISGNQGNVEVVKNYKQIYGIAPFKVLTVNPTMEELNAIGVNAQNEPNYIGDKTRIEIWCQSVLNAEPVVGSPDKSLKELGIEKQLVSKMSVFISNEQKSNSDKTKYVWINNYGQVLSAPTGSSPSQSWWKKQGERIAREGEIELIRFIRAWVNASPSTDEVFIDDWDKLMAGNVSEIREIIKTYKDNIVRSAIEISISKDGKAFAGIYNGHHEPWNVTGLKNWQDQFKTPRKNRFYSLTLKEFEHVEPTADTAAPEEAKSAWV